MSDNQARDARMSIGTYAEDVGHGYGSEPASLKQEQPNILNDLTQSQGETFDLISLLEKRLAVVAYQEPSDVVGLTGGEQSLHIGYNLENQSSINQRLRRILKSLVV